MRDFVDAETLTSEDPERVSRYFDEARRAAGELGVDLRLPRDTAAPPPARHPRPGAMRLAVAGAYVSYQGLAMPCCMVSTPDRINFGAWRRSGSRRSGTARGIRTFRDARLDRRRRRRFAALARSIPGTF